MVHTEAKMTQKAAGAFWGKQHAWTTWLQILPGPLAKWRKIT